MDKHKWNKIELIIISYIIGQTQMKEGIGLFIIWTIMLTIIFYWQFYYLDKHKWKKILD